MLLLEIPLVPFVAYSESYISSEGEVEISTTYIQPKEGDAYCRTCCHVLGGVFNTNIKVVPVPKKEWSIKQGEVCYKWSISPEPKGEVEGVDTSKLSVNLTKSDFPNSFRVSVEVTWILKNDRGEESNYVITKSMDFDAIDYTYTIKPKEDIDGRGDGELVDNHEGIINIDAKGCRRKNILDLNISGRATALTKQNEVNDFSVRLRCDGFEKITEWNIGKIYWYAKSGNPPDCCYSNPAEYKFVLSVDGCNEHEKKN